MKSRLVGQAAGEEAFSTITGFATRNGPGGASLSAIGAFERATVGWFDIAARRYRPIGVAEQCEGLSLLGEQGRNTGPGRA